MTILEEKHEFERARAEEERRRLANQILTYDRQVLIWLVVI